MEIKPGDVLEFKNKSKRQLNRVVLAVEGERVWLRNDSSVCSTAYFLSMADVGRLFRKAVER